MFYDTEGRDHGLPHDPFKAIVAPRPIGWISTISDEGHVNLAPYSFFNAISSRPDLVMFSSEGVKDSVKNVRQTKEFVANYASHELADQINMTSAPAPHETNEFEIAGLSEAPCKFVRPPRVAEALAALECKFVQEIELTDISGNSADSFMIIGQVVGVHIDDRAIKDGKFDVNIARPMARLGYRDYHGPAGYFEMTRPDWGGISGEASRKS
ncbi:MAG: flavin reductase family protein [Pseudomonadota bacterium]